MISIVITKKAVFYLGWIIGESGPIIQSFGKFRDSFDSFNDSDTFAEYIMSEQNVAKYINSKKDIKNISFSIDSDLLVISDLKKNEGFNIDDLISWQAKQIYGNDFNKIIDIYTYNYSLNHYLNFYFPRRIKTIIKDFSLKYKVSIKNIGVGIFSAETGVRSWYNAKKYDNYVVWKVCTNNVHEFIYVDRNEFSCYTRIKKNKVNSKILSIVGSNKDAETLCSNFNNYLNDGLRAKHLSYKKVFIYKVDGNLLKIKDYFNLRSNKFILLNPLNILFKENKKGFNKFNTLPLAESGISFRGVDV